MEETHSLDIKSDEQVTGMTLFWYPLGSILSRKCEENGHGQIPNNLRCRFWKEVPLGW